MKLKKKHRVQQEDAEYVVPKIPVSKRKGDNKLANLGKTSEDDKKESKYQYQYTPNKHCS
jgi:hypothetical protein